MMDSATPPCGFAQNDGIAEVFKFQIGVKGVHIPVPLEQFLLT